MPGFRDAIASKKNTHGHWAIWITFLHFNIKSWLCRFVVVMMVIVVVWWNDWIWAVWGVWWLTDRQTDGWTNKQMAIGNSRFVLLEDLISSNWEITNIWLSDRENLLVLLHSNSYNTTNHEVTSELRKTEIIWINH